MMMSLNSTLVRRSQRALRPGWFGFRRLASVLLLAAQMRGSQGFRLVDENGSITPFVPYEQGFVGRYGDPFTTYTSDRVNEGAPGTPTYPRLYEGVYPRQICPGMVGPVEDGMFYCLGKEHGYCDRRSGTCFCNVGYQGISCQDCSSTHYAEGGLCYPKLLCPGDCSGAGICHHSNGTCTCLPHRVGDDCSSPYCSSVFSSRCAECTFEECTSCESGYYVDHAGGGVDCLPCHRYDPRCTRCNEQSCLECTDPLLLSIRRSGARIGDPPLPFDEMERELLHALEFGTKDPRYFSSAEAFDVVANASSPLNETSVSCAQGVFGDDTWACESKAISHRVCGNPGTISFSSPEYRAFEDPSASAGATVYGMIGTTNGTVRVTVTRTGGGYGTVGVRYRLRHGTTDEEDVTPHAFFTTSDDIVFNPGVVEMSILLGVHQDGEAETDEKFDLLLFEPWGGARLGSQQRTTVTIVDAEGNGTVPHHSTTSVHHHQDDGDEYGDAWEVGEEDASADASEFVDGDDGRITVVAGTVNNATLVARDALGRLTGFGGDVFDAWVEVSRGAGGLNGDDADPLSTILSDLEQDGEIRVPAAAAADAVVRVEDLGSGNYTLSYQVNAAGDYLLHVALCRPGGLTGRYTSDSFSQVEEFRRVDRFMNFTWGAGPIAGTATDFVGVSWSGRIRSGFSETYEFEVGTAEGGGDAARLWIDGAVVIDGFERGGKTVGDWEGAEEGLGGGGRGFVNLTAGTLHDVFVEYSERRGQASFYVAWSSSSVPYEIVPPTHLYWVRELGSDGGGSRSPVALSVRSALTSGEKTEAFGAGTVSAVAAVPSTLIILPRDAFGNLRHDEEDSDLASSDRFTVVLEAIDYDYDYDNGNGDDATLGGVYGSAGSGGTVVTGKLEFDSESGVFVSEYVPFVAGTHLLNVTLQEWLFEPSETHVQGSPFTVTVSPGEAFGRRSEAWGDALLSNGSVAGVARSLRVRARDVVGNAIWDGGGDVALYAFHREVEAFTSGTVDDFGNGSYRVWMMPTVAGPYDISVAIDGQEVADSPYSVVVTPGDAYGPASSAYGAGVSAAEATIENIFYVQARDAWGNNLWGSDFNVTAALYVADTSAEEGGFGSHQTTIASNETDNGNWDRVWDGAEEEAAPSVVSLFGNGSGIALVSYFPRDAGTSFLYVHVDGLQVSGSPFEVDVSAGPARGVNATASGSALALATAGKNASFVIQARDQAANPAGVDSEGEQSQEGGSTSTTTQATEIVFNVTLTRTDDAQEDEDSGGADNSTTVVAATVEHLGNGRHKAVYNATKTGNYSLEVVDVADGEHAVGSPFHVVIEPNQAFAPATLVWWDRQVAGSNVIHIQAVDFWGNNVTQGGDAFVARWTTRDPALHETATPDNIATDNEGDVAVEEGDFWTSNGGWDDTASTAAGFFFPTSSGNMTATADIGSDTFHTFSGGYAGAYVTDVGGGRYEVTTATEAGSYWLEIGVVEPGGLWGTFYEDGGVETEVVSWTPEADWRTKSAVDFDWGVFSPEAGVDGFGKSSSLVSGVNVSESNGTSSTSSTSNEVLSSSLFSSERLSGNSSENGSSSSVFPADYFSARFTGFVKAEIGGEYHFRVVTDSNSRTALSIYGSDIFNDIVARPELSAESTGFSGSSSGFTPEMESQDTGACGDDASSASCSASVFGSVGNGGGVVITEGRTGSVVLTAGELVPLQLRYTHTTGEAWVRMEWASRHINAQKAGEGPSATAVVIPETNLFHHRPGWKVAVDLHPAATAAGASIIAGWPSLSDDNAQTIAVGAREEEEEEEEEAGGWQPAAEDGDEGTGIAPILSAGSDGGGGEIAAARLLLASHTRVTAGKTMEVVVQARDIYGNPRCAGGDSVQMYGQGPGGVILHAGSVVDSGDGNYTLSAWPVVAGAYHMSITVSALEPSRWALGYRNVEQAMAGAHVSGSPFRLLVVEGAAAANASLAYGVGVDAPLAGGVFGTSAFTIRARDAMGNRVSSGSTGDFVVEAFQTKDDGDSSLVSTGEAVYTSGGEYVGTYNVTVAGDYALHVTLSASGGHVAGSPFPVHVSPGPALAAASGCDDCEAILPSSDASAEGNFSANSTKLLRLSARDAFGNTLETGGEAWFLRLRGEAEAVADPGVRHPVVVDEGDGSYTAAIKPGVAGLYELQVMLLSKAPTGDDLAGLSGTFGGGGLTARYYTNARLAGRPLVTRIDPSIRLDWGSGVPNGVARVGSTGGTVGVRWEGFLRAPFSGGFTFTISTGQGDEARLWIRDELVIDTSSTSSANLVQQPAPRVPDVVPVFSRNSSFLTAGEAVRLRAEYIYHGSGGGGGSARGRAVRVVVGWESPGGIEPAQALPSFALYPSGGEVSGSPFGFSVVD